MSISLDGQTLRISDVATVAEDRETVVLDAEARDRIVAARSLVESWVAKDAVIYGITTGFGEFANVAIGRDDLEQLQTNLIRSHSVATGDPMPLDITRAMLLLRLNALAVGNSGIRLSVFESLLQMLNRNVIPLVPSQGSVGSSGDLVHLAHLVLGAMGEGEVHGSDGPEPASKALRRAGIEPITLAAKEGLALINGTQMMTAYGVLSLHRARRLAETAINVAAMSVEALRGTDRAFDERLHRLRPHPGQILVAARMRGLLRDSEIRESHRENDPRVQDAYSLRCIPQILGPSLDAIDYVDGVLTREINAATDNPLIFPEEGDYLEGGNFHGQPIALALDFLAIALSEIANVSERRTERMVNGALSNGLPRFLTANGGLNSGFMIAQYTAASLVSENKVLAHPASVDSIPTSANQEDHNSMGSIAARKLLRIVDNLEGVIAVEALCAAQGIDFLRPLRSSERLEKLHGRIREEIPHLNEDRVLHDDLQRMRELIRRGDLL